MDQRPSGLKMDAEIPGAWPAGGFCEWSSHVHGTIGAHHQHDYKRQRATNDAAFSRRYVGPKLRFTVLQRDNFTCQYCGARPTNARLVVDHIVAVAKGGLTTISNLVTACEPCNQGKSADDLPLWWGKATPWTFQESSQMSYDLGLYEEAAINLLTVMEYVPVDPSALAWALAELRNVVGGCRSMWISEGSQHAEDLIERVSTPGDWCAAEVGN